jgi:hypothetical protein
LQLEDAAVVSLNTKKYFFGQEDRVRLHKNCN